MHTHSAAHNYLFKHSTGYFFGIFSKCTVPMALQTMCRSTFAILQFKTMQALPERNTEEQREAFQPAALTYRKPLSHLAFAASRKTAVCVCVCLHAHTFQFDCMFLPCMSVLIVFMHACTCAHLNIFIFMSACCVCVCVCLYWYI